MHRHTKKCFLLLAGFVLIPFSFSQYVKLGSEEFPEHRYYPLKGQVYFTTYRQVRGEAYLTKDWITGTLYLANGQKIEASKYKFDAYAQLVVVYNDILNRVILPQEGLVTGFSFSETGGERFFKRVHSDMGIKRIHSGYFLEVLHDGEIGFYKLYLKTRLPLRAPEMPYIYEFVDEARYYIFRNDSYEPARLNKTYLKQKFPHHRKEISRYARNNHLKMKREKDFANMVSYIGQLESLVH